MARMFDLLSDVFETIRLKGTLYFRADYSPPLGHYRSSIRASRAVPFCDPGMLPCEPPGGALLVVLCLQKPDAMQKRTASA
jgi:AraC family transcriptional regulator, activator of mtrCDE